MRVSIDSVLLGISVLIPLLAGACGLLPRLRNVVTICVPLAGATGLIAALFVSSDGAFELPGTMLGARFALDETARTFLYFSSVLWCLAGFYGIGYFRGQARSPLYNAFYLFAMAGNFGLILARDAVTFYVFFALMSFASYGLVIHNRDDFSFRAGRIYMALVIVSEVALFAGIVELIAGVDLNAPLPVAGDMVCSSVTMALLTIGFGIKAGMLLLHVWLPLAHPAAPAPASAVLSGAMIKAGLLGWLRFLPIGSEGYESWGAFFMIAGLAAAFFGVAVGLAQAAPKTILAYSSISQMGFMTMGIGAGLLEPALWPTLLTGVTVYALHHGLAKGALFLSAGIAPGGMTRWSCVGAALPALALAGAPLTSGAAAKSALKSSIYGLPGHWPAMLSALLPAAAIGTGALMFRFLVVLRDYHPASHGESDRRWMIPAWAALVIASVFSIWFWDPGVGFAHDAFKAGKLFKAAWPVVMAATVGWFAYRWRPGFLSHWIGRVPPGDLLVPAEKAFSFLRTVKFRSVNVVPSTAGAIVQRIASRMARRTRRLEQSLAAWQFGLLLALALILLLFVLSLPATNAN